MVPPSEAYEEIIQEAAAEYDIDPALIRAVMQAESAFHPYAVSRAGAEGLMQLMPELADEMGVNDSFDPRENIMGGVRYLKRLLDYHNGNLDLALASYNAGPGNVAAIRRRAAVPRNPQLRQDDQGDLQALEERSSTRTERTAATESRSR